MDQIREKLSPFFNHRFFWHPIALPQFIYFTTCLFEDLVIYVAKGYWPLSFVENPWLRRLVLRQSWCV
jgi:hypothetical protein